MKNLKVVFMGTPDFAVPVLEKLIENTNVVFIRRKDDINNSLITCEVDNDGDIIQYLKKYNSNELTEEEREFKKLYQTHLNNTWKK